MRLMPGDIVLDRYAVEECLNRYEMAEFYLARHKWLEHQVVIKVLGRVETETTQARLQRSARLMTRVRSPNVASILDFGMSEGSPCLVTEHVEGETLRQRLKRSGPVPWPEAVEVMLGVLAGLQAVHDAGILHRNVKPDNAVMVGGGTDHVVLMDLGFAKEIEPGDLRITKLRTAVGTPAYMSPEQLKGRKLGTETDVYSAGILLYELLTGSLPEGKPTAAELLKRASSAPAPPVAPEGRPAFPPGLPELVVEAMRPAPDDRVSLEAFAARLRELGAGTDEPADGAAPRDEQADTAPFGGDAPAATLEAAVPPVVVPAAAAAAVVADVPAEPPTAAVPPADEPEPATATETMPEAFAMAAWDEPADGLPAAVAPFDASRERLRMRPTGPWASLAARADLGPRRSAAAAEPVAKKRGMRVRAMVAARIPRGELFKRKTAQWLGSIARGSGDSFIVAGQYWVAMVRATTEKDAQRTLQRIEQRLRSRFGARLTLCSRPLEASFQLARASIDGSAAPPTEVLELLEEVSRSHRVR